MSSGTKGHRELVAWQKAMALTEGVYAATARFPREEVYGLTAQLRRSAVSVPSNIAEGHGRGGGEFKRFVDIAYGSLMEVETQIEIAGRLKMIGDEEVATLLGLSNEVARLLNGLKRKLGGSSSCLTPDA